MTIGSPIPEIQFNLENSRSKVKVKGTPVSAASCWLISLMFHIRVFYRHPSLSFHDNRASHSRDMIWPWKFKVKGQGQSYASQCCVQLTHSLSVSLQNTLSTPVPFVPWQSGLPFPWYNLTLKTQGQSYDSQRSIQLTRFCGGPHQGILSIPVPFSSIAIGLPIPEILFDLEKFKVKGQGQRYPGQHNIQLTYFLFVSHQLDQPFLRYIV